MSVEVALVKVSWQPPSLHLLLQTRPQTPRISWRHEPSLHLGMGHKGTWQAKEVCVHVHSIKRTQPCQPLCICPGYHHSPAPTTPFLHCQCAALSSPGWAKPEEPSDFCSCVRASAGLCAVGAGGASSTFPRHTAAVGTHSMVGSASNPICWEKTAPLWPLDQHSKAQRCL